MDIKSFPNNQTQYTGAEPIMRWLHGRSSGVFGADGNAAVTAAGGMTVAVSDGIGWMSNASGDGIAWWLDEEAQTGTMLTLPIALADSSRPRIDRVVVSWETTNYVALPTITILQGAPNSSPVAPALTNNNTLRQISLARILVNAGATTITAMDITDERLDPSVCGIVTEGVRVDTSVWQGQLEAMVDQLRRAIEQAEFGILPDGSVTPAKLDREYFATASEIILTAGVHYGDSLPAVGVPGQLFFRKV